MLVKNLKITHLLLALLFALLALFVLFTLFTPTPVHAQEGTRNSKRVINLEFEPVPNATLYEIELTAKHNREVKSYKLQTPKWSAELPPGEYTLRLRAYDQRKVPGEWSDPSPIVVKILAPEIFSPKSGSEIKTGEARSYETPFVWQKMEGAEKYRVDVISSDGKVLSRKFRTNNGKIRLPVARRYRWKVTPIGPQSLEGETQNEPTPFILWGGPLPSPQIEKPEDPWVEKLEWDNPSHTESISYILQRKEGPRRWRTITKAKDFRGEKIPFYEKYPGGRYRFGTKAHAPLRESSRYSVIEFDVASDNRSPEKAEEARLRYSLEKPTPWYFIGSYLLSKVEYEGQSPEINRKIAYTALVGTGRVGIGYIPPGKIHGAFGIVDLSGLTVNGRNVTYAAAEAHSVWRFTWGRNMLRPSAGLFYKELVESRNTSDNLNYYKQQKLSYLGPHAGIDFWRPFTSKLGLQFNARLYYSLTGLETPNDRDLSPELSYQIGFMGSYKVKHHITGYLGWAYRLDKATYESTPLGVNGSLAAAGSNQEIEIAGHYLNLMLEWGF